MYSDQAKDSGGGCIQIIFILFVTSKPLLPAIILLDSYFRVHSWFQYYFYILCFICIPCNTRLNILCNPAYIHFEV